MVVPKPTRATRNPTASRANRAGMATTLPGRPSRIPDEPAEVRRPIAHAAGPGDALDERRDRERVDDAEQQQHGRSHRPARTAANAMGRARTPPPTVSVSVSAYASQNGGRSSSRREIAARRHRRRSRMGNVPVPRAARSWPVCCRYGSTTAGSSAPRTARSVRAWMGRPYLVGDACEQRGPQLVVGWQQVRPFPGVPVQVLDADRRTGGVRPAARAARNSCSCSSTVRSVSKRAMARRDRATRRAVRLSTA